MATIRLNNNDLRTMIREALDKLYNGNQEEDMEILCRFPFPVGIVFTDHAIDREYQREITEKRIIDDVKQVIKKIAADYLAKEIEEYESVLVVNRDTCLTVIGSLRKAKPNYNHIRAIFIVRTCYIWDGRVNFGDQPVYGFGEESPEYIKAEIWNRDHQDLVMDYNEWRRINGLAGIADQRREANKWYNDKHNFFTKDDPNGNRMGRINATTRAHDKERMQDIYDQMDPEDFKAIADYDMKMDYVPLTQKGSMNRDLRAMDLRKMRKDAARQRKYYGDSVKDVPDEDLVKYPKAVGKIELTPEMLGNRRKRG